MLQLEKELENYKPMMDVNELESQINTDDAKDIVDLINAKMNTHVKQKK